MREALLTILEVSGFILAAYLFAAFLAGYFSGMSLKEIWDALTKKD